MSPARTRKARSARRRALRMSRVEHDLTADQWAALVTAWGGCAYCGASGPRLQRDCVLPISRGGRYTLANVVPACDSCNASKCNLEVSTWIRRRRLDERAFLQRHPRIVAELTSGSTDTEAPTDATAPAPAPPVTLRPLVPADARIVAGWGDDPAFRDHAGWSRDRTRAELEAFHHDLVTDPPAGLVRLGALVGTELVGYVDLHGDQPRRRELGFVVGGRERWGRGLGTRLGAAGLVHGFEVLGLDQVWAEALDANSASVRVLQRLGLVETGPGEPGDFLGRATRYRRFAIERTAWSHDPGATSPDS